MARKFVNFIKLFLVLTILIFSLQSWTKADDSTEYITKKKQTSYITKKSKYITKKEIKKTNYKLLLLFPLGFIII